jgi:hypothetical protein
LNFIRTSLSLSLDRGIFDEVQPSTSGKPIIVSLTDLLSNQRSPPVTRRVSLMLG